MRLPIPPTQIKKRLLQDNLITEERFQAFQLEAERKNQNLIDILISEKIVDPFYINGIIAEVLGVQMANLQANRPDPEVLKLLSEDIARQRETLIFRREEDAPLDVAMGDPTDLEGVVFLRQP